MESTMTGMNLMLNINNLNLSYDDVGEGNIPIIFLHGFPFDKSMWAKQLDFFATTNRVIAIDIRGFGKSTDESTPLSIDLFSDDLMLFMNQMKISKAIICGLSMGGFIALNAQARFPDRFEAIILCDTQCIADTIEVKLNRYKTIDEIALNGTLNFNEAFIKKVFCKNSFTNKQEIVTQLRSVVMANPEQIVINGLKALAERSETCSTLPEINIPTLIICGREDEVTPLEQSEFLHTSIKASALHIIDDAGHVSNIEQPEEFNNEISKFLLAVGVFSKRM
ncbi:MAG: alpha/beta hydrolase [Chitinophagales bacterium]